MSAASGDKWDLTWWICGDGPIINVCFAYLGGVCHTWPLSIPVIIQEILD